MTYSKQADYNAKRGWRKRPSRHIARIIQGITEQQKSPANFDVEVSRCWRKRRERKKGKLDCC